MLSKNNYYYIQNPNIQVIDTKPNILYKLKNKLINRINKIKSSNYLYTFILGDTSYINENVKESYISNGISHLFSVSGMHITLLSTILLFLLNKIKKTNINYIIVIIFLIFFMFLTNFSASVIRSVCLFIFLYINKILKLNLNTYKILLYILCINIIINPFNIYNSGFIFSYTISLYLIIFSKLINNYKLYISKIFITSLISFLVSIPILINNYHSINILTPFFNMIFVPLVSILIFPFSIITLIFPYFDFAFEFLIKVLEYLSLTLSNFKIEILLCHTSIFVIAFYFLIITFILYKFMHKKYVYIIFIIILIFIHTNINYINENTVINIIDVNQGDCLLIKMPYNKSNILIDTGGNIYKEYYKDIISILKSKGIKKLNYLILTHGDYDHMGEAINLVNNYKVENVILNCGEYNSLEKNLIKVLDKKNIKYYSCIRKLNIDKYKLEFLKTKIYDNENDNSNVIFFNYNGYKFLFMGDAGMNKEKDILDKYNLTNIDFLKVGHHGSDTSSSKYFINSINPKYSLISVGKNNRYGHPKKSVLDILKSSKIYRTDKNGSIEIKLNKNGYKIKTCHQ